eukprot:TRINITY_DN11080_c0_g2_i5.p1 TRINITY_DN11080_c0_g2~~TRINITY_DN11080_c0_g2_i5.p1  ORF type:complete len:147 (+),score=37.28 TRINITY_DN11080_c0_g2_i5:243-683(+)
MKQILNTMKIINQSFKKEPNKADKESISVEGGVREEAPEKSESEVEVVRTPTAENSVEFQLVPNTASNRTYPKAKLVSVKELGLVQVIKYLGYRLKLAKKQIAGIRLLARAESGAMKVLSGDETLEVLERLYWKQTNSKVIYYAIN